MLVAGGEEAGEGDGEVDGEVGGHVVEGLAGAGGGGGHAVGGVDSGGAVVAFAVVGGGGEGAGGGGDGADVGGDLGVVGVWGEVAGCESGGFVAGFGADVAVAEAGALTEVDGASSPEVGKAEVATPIAAVGGAEEGEEGLVLGDGEELAVAESPAAGWKVEAKGLDLADERF